MLLTRYLSKAPLTRISTKTLTLRNTTESRIAFKVKTTAPKLYFVRPNASIVLPHQSATVSVIMQPLKEEPSPDTQCTDKFLVMFVDLNEDESLDATSEECARFWSNNSPEFKERVINKKVRVRYLFNELEEPLNDSNEAPAVAAAAGFAPTVKHTNVDGNYPLNSDDKLEPLRDTPLDAEKRPFSEPTKTPSMDPTSEKNNLSRSLNEPYSTLPSYSKSDDASSLQDALKQAQSRIDALSAELEAKKSPYSSTGSATKTVKQQAGIPLPQTALLVLIAFLIGWFFF